MTSSLTEVKQVESNEFREDTFRPFRSSPNTECKFRWRPAPEDDALSCGDIEILELYLNGVPFLDKIKDTPHYSESDLKLLCLAHLVGI